MYHSAGLGSINKCYGREKDYSVCKLGSVKGGTSKRTVAQSLCVIY